MSGFDQFAISEDAEKNPEHELSLKGEQFGKGSAAKYAAGIVYKAPWETECEGVAIAARRQACAIRRTGLPVFLQTESATHWNHGYPEQVTYSELPQSVLDEVDHVTEIQHNVTVATIHHCVLTEAKLESIVYPPNLGGVKLEALQASREMTILYCGLETNAVPKTWASRMNKLGQIWVPCLDNKRWLEQAGVDPEKVKVIPHPLAFRDPMRKAALLRNQLGARPFRFLNVAKWEPRKAQHELIGGFLKYFTPAREAELVLKSAPFSSFKGYPETPDESCRQWLEDADVKKHGWTAENLAAHVKVLWKTKLTREELAKLYAECEVYVSCGRCEGSDLPALDAKVAGMRVIYGGLGGTADFCGLSDIRIESHKNHIPHEGYRMPAGTMWSGFDERALERAIYDADKYRWEELIPFDSVAYAIDTVGARMRFQLNDFVQKTHNVDISKIDVDWNPKSAPISAGEP